MGAAVGEVGENMTAGFLYFIPGITAVDDAVIAAAGLTHALPPGFPRHGGMVTVGPDGQRGYLVTDGRCPPARAKYVPQENEAQRWRRIPGSNAWCGLWDDARPGPADLARPAILGGHPVKLGDGNDWMVPVARQYVEEDGELRWLCALPTRIDLDDAGEVIVGEVVARLRPLWSLAENYEAARDAGLRAYLARQENEGDGGGIATNEPVKQSVTFSFADEIRGAALAVGTNYRIGLLEAVLLNLLDDVVVGQVLDAVIDMPTRMAWVQKKTESAVAGATTGAGGSA